jgi:hypothetical protein
MVARAKRKAVHVGSRLAFMVNLDWPSAAGKASKLCDPPHVRFPSFTLWAGKISRALFAYTRQTFSFCSFCSAFWFWFF